MRQLFMQTAEFYKIQFKDILRQAEEEIGFAVLVLQLAN